MNRCRFAVLVCVLVLGTTVGAQSFPFRQVVPASAATTEGASSTALPFGSTFARRVMYAYEGSTVGYGRPVRIAAISLRADGTTPGASGPGSYSFTLDVSTSRNPALALSDTFHQNHGHDRLRVFAGTLPTFVPPIGAAPNPFSLRIPFMVPFDWDPRSGPLLLDFGYSASTPGFGAWDAVGGNEVRGKHGPGSGAVVAIGTLGVAPVLQLEIAGEVVPSAFAATEASSFSSWPWGPQAGASMRTLNLFEASSMAFQGRQRITALAWRTNDGAAFPGRSYTVRVSLSTSPNTAATLDGTFANNHGPDRAVVFDGVIDAPATPASGDLGQFDVVCEFQRPFEYDPALGALAIDMQLFDCTGPFLSLDASDLTPGVGRITDPVSATSSFAFNVQPGVALVTALRAMPLPTVPAALSHTTSPPNGNQTLYPFGFSDARALMVLSAADAAVTAPFSVRHLRFRPAAVQLASDAMTWTGTIDLSHAAVVPATTSTTFDQNHGLDRERVFDGSFSLPAFTRTADDPRCTIEIALQRPFLWDPAVSPYLVVDLRVTGRTGAPIRVESTFGQPFALAFVTSAGADATTGGVQPFAPVVQLGGDGPNALATNYGFGCAGTNGRPETGSIGLPELPNPDFRITIRDALGNAPVVFVAGFAQASVPLPGAPGCSLWHAAEIGILGWTITDPVGSGDVPLPLADDLSMHDLVFRTQWIVLDPANPLGLVTSDAQVMTAKFF